MTTENGRYVAPPNPTCPACLLISCDCTEAEVAQYLAEEAELRLMGC